MTSLRPLSSGGLLARLALGWCQEHEFLEGSHHFLTDKSGRTYTVQNNLCSGPVSFREYGTVVCARQTVTMWPDHSKNLGTESVMNF